MARARTLLLVVTPAVAMATLAVGLHLGATTKMRAAVVFGSPPSAGVDGLAWRVQTIVAGGAPEPVSLASLAVTAKSGGRVAEWKGSSTVEGVAEVLLALPGIKPGDPLELVVTDASDGTVLARGEAAWESAPPAPGLQPWNAYSRREGAIALDVVVYGARLALGASSPIWVRATDRATSRPLAGVTLRVEAGMGLKVGATSVATDDRGWAVLAALATTHAASLSITASLGEADAKVGAWTSALSVAAGADATVVPERVAPGEARGFELLVASSRASSYVEIDDAHGGRAAGAVVALREDPSGGRGLFVAPPLREGLYWLVTAAERNGAELMESATLARPFFVAATDEAALALGPMREACARPADPHELRRALGPCVAAAVPPPFARWTALDGLPPLRAKNAAIRQRGTNIALASVSVAAALEAVLILGAVLEARKKLRAAQEGRPELAGLKKRFDAVTVIAALLLALMGFGLIATLLVSGSG